jgi:hypothetical protein
LGLQVDPRVATSTASIVCRRFSAWSKTMESGALAFVSVVGLFYIDSGNYTRGT